MHVGRIGAGAALLAASLAAPVAATAQDLGALAPLIAELVAPEERLSDDEIRERSLEAGVGELLSSRRATPDSVFRAYRVGRAEERRLKAERQARKRRQVEAAIGAFSGLMRGLPR